MDTKTLKNIERVLRQLSPQRLPLGTFATSRDTGLLRFTLTAAPAVVVTVEDTAGAFPVRTLDWTVWSKAVKAAKAATIEVGEVSYKAGSTTYKLPLSPVEPEVPSLKATVAPSTLDTKALAAFLPIGVKVAPKDRPSLEGFLLSEGKAQVTDGHRLFVSGPLVATPGAPGKVFTPQHLMGALLEAVKVWPTATFHVSAEGDWVTWEVEAEGVTLTLQDRGDVAFPDTEPLLADAFKGARDVDLGTGALKAAIQAIKPFHNKAVPTALKVFPSEDRVTLDHPDVKVDLMGFAAVEEPYTVGVNLQYLEELVATMGETTTLHLRRPLEPLAAETPEGGLWLLMPMRIED